MVRISRVNRLWSSELLVVLCWCLIETESGNVKLIMCILERVR